jgi:hypothetical protein
MKRSLLIVVIAGITVSAGAWLFAQSAKAPPAGPDLRNAFDAPKEPQPPTAPPASKPEEFTSSPQLKTTTVEAINLRNRFIELSKKKALLMKEAQLKNEIERLERQIPELEAWARAEEAIQILREIAEKHPNTSAAATANAAIRLIEERKPGYIEPRPERGPSPFVPALDPGFERGASPDPGPRLRDEPFSDAPSSSSPKPDR